MKQTNSGNTETSTQQSIKPLREHLLFCFRALKCDDPETVIQANLGFSIDRLEEMARERNRGDFPLELVANIAFEIITEVHAAQPNKVLEQWLRSMSEHRIYSSVYYRVRELICSPDFIEGLLEELINRLVDQGTQAEAYDFLDLLACSGCIDREPLERSTTDPRLLLMEWVHTGTL